MLKIVLGILSVYVIWLLILYFLQDSILFPTHYLPDVKGGAPFSQKIETIWVNDPDGTRIEAWYLPLNSTSPTKQPTVVLFHGNAELIDFLVPESERFQKMGFNVLMPEYRGYGRSGGKPSQALIRKDIEKILKIISQKPEIDMDRIVFYGRSIGGGVACDVAAKVLKPAALILQSTFTSVTRMALSRGAPWFLVKNKFDNAEAIKGLSIPILIAHGQLDSMIPFDHAVRLKEMARNATLYQVNANHNDFPMGDGYWAKIEEFLQQHNIIP